MLSFCFQPFPALTTQRLMLRQIRDEDADEILFLRSDENVLRYINRAPLQSSREALEWIKMVNAGVAKNDYITWALQLKEEHRLIGTITIWNTQKEHHRAEIGYLIHPEYQGKGLMQEAITAVLNYGFTVMKLHSIEAHVHPENSASINLLKRNGFVQEGYFKENFYFDGQFLDTAVFSLIAPKKL